MKTILKKVADGILKLLGTDEAQKYLIEKADTLAGKTSNKVDDWFVDQFRELWEKWRLTK